jgi:thioredoxin reductase (NADPH)
VREEVNVVVVGAGPAGSAAAVFLKRAGIEPVLLEESVPGGLLREANLVENYPGFPAGIVGEDLADLIAKQLERLDVRVERRSAVNIEAGGENRFVIRTEGAEYEAHAVVVATGTAPRRIGGDWAGELEGRALFYGLSSLDLDAVEGRRVAVLGGGDAAFDYALNLQARGGSVKVILRTAPTCLPLLLDRAAERGIEVHDGCLVERIDEAGGELKVACAGEKVFECDLVVVAHGREPRLEALAPDLVESVRSSAELLPETTTDGLYVAGDVVRGRCRQTAIAAGDGVLAAMKVIDFLKERGVCA